MNDYAKWLEALTMEVDELRRQRSWPYRGSGRTIKLSLSYAELARRSGLSPATVSRFCRGLTRLPQHRTVFLLSVAANISPETPTTKRVTATVVDDSRLEMLQRAEKAAATRVANIEASQQAASKARRRKSKHD